MLVQSINRAMDILFCISKEKNGLKLVNICEKVQLPKSTVHRLLESLIENGMVEKKETTYKVGTKVVEIASVYLNNLELKTEAYIYIKNLADKYSKAAHLAILNDDTAIYIDKVSYISAVRMYSDIGKRVPLHCTAVGKILLSSLPAKQLKFLIDNMDFKKFTKKTLTKPEEIYQEVIKVKENRLAYDIEEHEERMICVAAPIYDYRGVIIAAVSLSGIQKNQLENVSKDVLEACCYISEKFGYFKNKGGDDNDKRVITNER